VPSFTVYLPKRVYDKVARLAERERVSIAGIVRALVEQGLTEFRWAKLEEGEKERRGERGATA